MKSFKINNKEIKGIVPNLKVGTSSVARAVIASHQPEKEQRVQCQ